MSDEELKPCPFCGVKPKLENYYAGRFIIQCRNDTCLVSVKTNWAYTQREVIFYWNDRKNV